MRTPKIATLHELINSREFDAYRGDKLGNDLFINDPERAERCYDAAENGSDGSTHAEIIEDWRDFLATLDDLSDSLREDIQQEINDCEAWHEKQGTLWEQVG